jgi:hypothetical protein
MLPAEVVLLCNSTALGHMEWHGLPLCGQDTCLCNVREMQ